ncbi:MAG: tRNA adenosine(34) deaminase TadA [Parvularculaceae bacterium]|nr:tRNA adenosine(34) deaminase TadA [Parvularculaceae bacterium]
MAGVMSTENDTQWMARALELAAEAADSGEVPVGAVILGPDGELLAEAHNGPIARSDPTAHAEIVAIRKAAEALGNYRLTGCTLYVTLEPCAMCTGAISHARIGRLVYGASDPKGGAVAHGPKLFEQPTLHHRPEVTSGLMADEASEMLKSFFRARRKKL